MNRIVLSLAMIAMWQASMLSAAVSPCGASPESAKPCCCCGDSTKCGCGTQQEDRPGPCHEGARLCTCGSQGDFIFVQLRAPIEPPRALVEMISDSEEAKYGASCGCLETEVRIHSPPDDLFHLDTIVLLI